MSIQTISSVRQRLCAKFFSEVGLYGVFGAAIAHPQHHAALQIIHHREIHLAFAPAHFIDADDVYRRAFAIPQAILDGSSYNARHALPIQRELPRRALPAQLPRQPRHGMRQPSGHARPRFGPRKVFHTYSAARAIHSSWAVAQPEGQVSKGQIPPLALPSQTMHLPASPMANTATQQPLSQAIDANHHAVFGHLYPGYAVDFQSQLFSVMSFDEHSTPTIGPRGRCAAAYKMRRSL